MATLRAKRAVKKILENRGMGISRIMLDPEVGYKATTAKNPKNLTESKGFKEAMAEYGLTDELISTSLVADIKAKPKKRFFELSLGADILKMKGPTSYNDNRQVIINISDEKSRRLLDRKTPAIGEG